MILLNWQSINARNNYWQFDLGWKSWESKWGKSGFFFLILFYCFNKFIDLEEFLTFEGGNCLEKLVVKCLEMGLKSSDKINVCVNFWICLIFGVLGVFKLVVLKFWWMFGGIFWCLLNFFLNSCKHFYIQTVQMKKYVVKSLPT